MTATNIRVLTLKSPPLPIKTKNPTKIAENLLLSTDCDTTDEQIFPDKLFSVFNLYLWRLEASQQVIGESDAALRSKGVFYMHHNKNQSTLSRLIGFYLSSKKISYHGHFTSLVLPCQAVWVTATGCLSNYCSCSDLLLQSKIPRLYLSFACTCWETCFTGFCSQVSHCM